jgi:predicted glycoside hydrolase/deacetylase ChbG (UPF0249 family)
MKPTTLYSHHSAVLGFNAAFHSSAFCRLGLSMLVSLLLVQASLAAETWAERLGYPADKRVVILHASHGGAAYEFNRPSQQALGEGSLQSASVIVPGPWFPQYALWCRDNNRFDVGVCLTLSSPNGLCRWRPVTAFTEVPSLVDVDGYFCRSLLQVALRADVEEVQRELHRQIEQARKAGIRPTHLIPHQGVLLTRPDLLEVYLRTAEKYWIPAVMIELTPAHVERLREEGFPLTQEIIDLVTRYRLPKLDDLQSVPDADSYEAKRESFFDLIRGLQPGITQITLSPADETAALKAVSPRWQNHVWEAKLLADPAVRQFLKKQGVLLTNWVDMMRRFENHELR